MEKLMKLHHVPHSTIFEQEGYAYGFSVANDIRPDLVMTVLFPDHEKDHGTIRVYCVDFTGKSAFQAKPMVPPTRSYIEALKAQWTELSQGFIKYDMDRLDKFENEEGEDFDSRCRVENRAVSIERANDFFIAQDFMIDPKPNNHMNSHLVTAVPLPPAPKYI